jgi:RNA-splicing ligase RtcB
MSGWDHFQHMADIGVHGFGESLAEAFEQAALTMMAVIADPARVRQDDVVEVVCTAPDRELLLVDWLNAWVYEIATRNMPRRAWTCSSTCPTTSARKRNTFVDGQPRRLFVHRKGTTRAFGPGHPSLPPALRAAGQPVIIGGSMGTASYILAGCEATEVAAFASACHGAGRSMSRNQATRRWQGRAVVDELARRGILIRSPSLRGVAEEAPGAYKDVSAVVDVAAAPGLAKKVARLEPLVCVKG